MIKQKSPKKVDNNIPQHTSFFHHPLFLQVLLEQLDLHGQLLTLTHVPEISFLFQLVTLNLIKMLPGSGGGRVEYLLTVEDP